MESKRPGGEMKAADPTNPTKSQLIPLSQDWGSLTAKPYFWPGVVTAVLVAFLFYLMNSKGAYTVSGVWTVAVPEGDHFIAKRATLNVPVPYYIIALALYMSAGIGYGIYRMIGKFTTPIWVMVAVAVVTGFLLGTVVLDIVHILSFGVNDLGPRDTFIVAFVKGFFAAGLPEETLKAIPVAVGVWLTFRIKDRSSPLWHFRVTEPLDGVLIGVASGIGFTFAETVFHYVPQTIVFAATNYAAPSAPLQLLIPRVLGNVGGHAAWAGIVGYYIGLAYMRPAQWRKTAITGVVIAAALHGAWDSNLPDFMNAVAAGGSFLLLMLVTIKARSISPNRDQLARSTLADEKRPDVQQSPSNRPGFAPGGDSVTPVIAQFEKKSITWDDGSNMLMVEIGTARIPASPGQRLYERQAPGTTASRGDNIVGEVMANPSDPNLLGLKNLSTQVWKVTTSQGEARELTPGRTIALAAGTRIQLGDLVAEVK